MAGETYTQVAPDSTGDKIRTREIEILQSNGTRVTVSMQIVTVADSDGNILGTKQSPLYIDSERLSLLLENLTNEVIKLRTVIEFSSGITLD